MPPAIAPAARARDAHGGTASGFLPHLTSSTSVVPDTVNLTRSADHAVGRADGRPRLPSSAPVVPSKPQYICLHDPDEGGAARPCMPESGQRLFTSGEVSSLRREARQTYAQRQRAEERRAVTIAEKEARTLLTDAAIGQLAAVRAMERDAREAHMRAASEAALPVQYLEQRIRQRIHADYAATDAALREEGREAWRTQVELLKTEKEGAAEREAERRAAVHRFSAAATFVMVQERTSRQEVVDAEMTFWDTLAPAEAESRAEAERLALERFLNTPEQLALAAAREQRERQHARRVAKLTKLFQTQQDGFINGCRHGTGGSSLFAGPNAKKLCGRCRVKWDEELGYFVSIDRAVKIHPPPPPPAITADADGAAAAARSPAAKSAQSSVAPRSSVFPPLKQTAAK